MVLVDALSNTYIRTSVQSAEMLVARGVLVKGFVPTPAPIVDTMVAKLFEGRPPLPSSTLLDPGCGTGAFIEGVLRWCSNQALGAPQIVGVESDARLLAEANERLGSADCLSLLNEDFLQARREAFDYIIGNPPYVPITGLTESERAEYRTRFSTATGRFDLYLLFFEQALRSLKPGGRLVFITPEKFMYVQTAEPLRKALSLHQVDELHLLDEDAFEGLTTYPAVTTVLMAPNRGRTKVIQRDGVQRVVALPKNGSSWLPAICGSESPPGGHTLGEATERISCGVATGADHVFVVETSKLTPRLRNRAFPTISGRELAPNRRVSSRQSLLIPYTKTGELLNESELGELGDFLKLPNRQEKLLARTCVRRKPWYAFHENPPMAEMLRPKILCKDITARPFFVMDEAGDIVPRHSVYYIIPKDPSTLNRLCDYLNSAAAQAWLLANCQRAANGFLRLQSHVMRALPVPADLVPDSLVSWYPAEAVG
jgi:SAM-dependent methyltransferase